MTSHNNWRGNLPKNNAGAQRATVYLTENFESGTITGGGWAEQTLNASYNWDVNTSTPIQGVYDAMIGYDPAPADQDEWIISPKVDLSASAAPEISFSFRTSYYWMVTPNNNADLRLMYSTDNGTTWAEKWSEQTHGVFTSWATVDVVLNFPELAGKSQVRIAFNYKGKDASDLVLDNIMLAEKASGPVLSTIVTELEAPKTAVNDTLKSEMDFAIAVNKGTQPLIVTLSSTSADFGFNFPNLTVAAGDTLKGQLMFHPKAVGNRSGYIVINSNDPSNPTDSIHFTGVAIKQGYAVQDFQDYAFGSWNWKLKDVNEDLNTWGWFYAYYGGVEQTTEFVAGFQYGKDMLTPKPTAEDYLISPKFNVVTGDSIYFDFWTYDSISTVEVVVSETGSAKTADFTTQLDRLTSTSTNPETYAYSLSAFAGKTIRVAFRVKDLTGTMPYSLSLVDNIVTPKPIFDNLADFSGLVTSPFGNPVAGAMVFHINGSDTTTTYTDFAGEYFLQGVAFGQSKISVTAQGFVQKDSVVTVSENTTYYLNLRLSTGAPVVSFSGTVKSTNNNAINGAIVTLTNNATSDMVADTTDANGAYYIEIEGGTYSISYFHPSYSPFDTILVITANKVVDVKLQSIPALGEFVESFEGLVFPPLGWSGADWITSTTWKVDGLNSARSPVDPAGIYPLVSRSIDLSKVTKKTLSFWWRETSLATGLADSTQVQISTDEGSTWTTLRTLRATTNVSLGKYEEIDLSSYNGIVKLRWNYGTDGSLDAWWFYLDKVAVGATKPMAPKNLTATTIPGKKEVKLSWETNTFTFMLAQISKEKTPDFLNTRVGREEASIMQGSFLPKLRAGEFYKIYRSVGGDSSFTYADSTSSLSFTDTKVNFGTNYRYYVTLVKGVDESEPSEKVSVTPTDWMVVNVTGTHHQGFEHPGMFPPVGWSVKNTSKVGYYWSHADSTMGDPAGEMIHTGGHSAFVGWHATETSDEWLMTPLLVIPKTNFATSIWSLTSDFWAAGAQLSIYRTSDKGVTWEQIFKQVPGTIQTPEWIEHPISTGGKDTVAFAFVYQGVDGDRVVVDDFVSKSTVSNDGSSTITDYALNQNYPNPFNPSTTISFSLRESGSVTLNVYNILGELVATVLNGEFNAGSHTVQFNASHLPSGMYFYSLESQQFKSTKKMLLLK